LGRREREWRGGCPLLSVAEQEGEKIIPRVRLFPNPTPTSKRQVYGLDIDCDIKGRYRQTEVIVRLRDAFCWRNTNVLLTM